MQGFFRTFKFFLRPKIQWFLDHWLGWSRNAIQFGTLRKRDFQQALEKV